MTRARSVFFAALALVVTPLVIAGVDLPTAAQTPGPPTSPATQSPPPKSTALIVGQVTDGSTGQPIPEAIVLLRPTSPGARGAGGLGASAAGFAAAMGGDPGNAAAAAAMAAVLARGAGAGPGNLDQRVLTGSDGRFVFHTLPPGQYQLSASLNGYAASLGTTGGELNPMMLVTGLSRGMATTAFYALGEGEVLKDVKLRLWKYASVTGTVLDDAGEPAVGLTVQAIRRTLTGGRARYTPAGTGRTDDRGVYRIAALLPGDYLIVMPQTQMAVPAAMIEKIIDIGLTGRLDAADQASTAAIGQLLATTGGNFGAAMNHGVRLGSYMVASGGGSVPMVGADGHLSAYRTAFFPDASTPVDATVVSLKSGDERAGADFQLRLTPTVAVSGIAMGPNGPEANLAVRLVVPGDRIVSDTEFDVATSVTTADGRFSFFGVPPGQFLLRALKSPLPMMAPGVASAGSPPSEVPLFAVVDVTVGTTDVRNLTVQLAETFSVSGRVEFESRAGVTAPPTLKGAGVMLLPADGQTPNIFTMGRPAPVSENSTFLRTGLVPGRYFLDLPSVPAPWLVKSATLDGRDVLDMPLEIRNGSLAGVVITLTDRLAQLSGTVTASNQDRPSDAAVIVFPADYRAWIDNGMNPRLARTTRATPAGAYSIPRLTAGDYFVVAIDRSDEGDLQDPAFIEVLSRGATRVTITTEARTQALTMTRVRR